MDSIAHFEAAVKYFHEAENIEISCQDKCSDIEADDEFYDFEFRLFSQMVLQAKCFENCYSENQPVIRATGLARDEITSLYAQGSKFSHKKLFGLFLR